MIDTSGFEQRVRRFLTRFLEYVKGEAEKTGYELQAHVSDHMRFTQPTVRPNKSDKLRIQSGDLSRALQPNQGGNIFTVDARDRSVFDVTYGVDEEAVPYAAIHEYGGFIEHKGKMPGYWFYRAGEQSKLGRDNLARLFIAYAISAKKKGGVKIPKRPYFDPGLKDYRRSTWPKKLDRIRSKLAEIWGKS